MRFLGSRGRSLAVYAVLANTAIVTGAVSFFGRPFNHEASVEVQRGVYESLRTRGAGGKSADWLVRSHSGRVLMPVLMGGLAEPLGLGWPRAFGLVRLLSIAAAYFALFVYFRALFIEPVALCGVLFVASAVPITFSNGHELPTDFPDVFFWAAALLLLRRRALLAFTLVVAVATLNRETCLFLAVLLCLRWFLASRDDRFSRWWLAAAVAAWALPYFLLKWWTQIPATGGYPLSFSYNLTGLSGLLRNFHPYNQFLFYLWLLGPFWVLPFLGRLPKELRASVWMLPPFLILHGLIGYLNEPRTLMALYPLLVPAGLFLVFPAAYRGWPSPDLSPGASSGGVFTETGTTRATQSAGSATDTSVVT